MLKKRHVRKAQRRATCAHAMESAADLLVGTMTICQHLIDSRQCPTTTRRNRALLGHGDVDSTYLLLEREIVYYRIKGDSLVLRDTF